MSREIIRAKDMTSALDLAERKLGSDVLIIKSSDLGGHVEIEVERGKPQKDLKIKNFDTHLKSNMQLNKNIGLQDEITTEKFLMENNDKEESLINKNNTSSSIKHNEDKYLDIESTFDVIKQDIADLKALATSVIISDRLASNTVREEFLCLRLREIGFSPKLLFNLLGGNSKKQSLTLFSNMLANQISVENDFKLGNKRIIVVSGASGVGKTTLVAKIAASIKMQGKKLSLIDTDKGHVAAGDSLRCFGRMLDVDVLGINTDNLPSLNELLTRYDNLVIDMPSSLNMSKQLANLFAQPGIKNNVESYLATSCSASPGLFASTMDAIKVLDPKIALTKLDEGPIEFRLINHLASEKNIIAMFAGGIDITTIPEICTKPSLAQYLLNELHSTLNWNESNLDNTHAQSSNVG